MLGWISVVLEAAPYALPVLLVILGFFAGRRAERRHHASLDAREAYFAELAVRQSGIAPEGYIATQAPLVIGAVVISSDYFKRLAARLRKLVGGRILAYETLLERARREAILRLKDAARGQGADMVINLRLETSRVFSKAPVSTSSFEVLAYGTALRRVDGR